MIISLIGMSGSGKTYWSNKLGQAGFKRFCCDDLIEERLSDELKELGYSGIADVSRWMGQPYDGRYQRTSKKYLSIEQEVVDEVIDWVISAQVKQNIVIDTTGSLIYINSKTLTDLKKVSKIIYLKVSQMVKEEMFKLYIKDPKPVIWGESFKKAGRESGFKALGNSYPSLLEYRSSRYAQLADQVLDYDLLRSKAFDINNFLELIK